MGNIINKYFSIFILKTNQKNLRLMKESFVLK